MLGNQICFESEASSESDEEDLGPHLPGSATPKVRSFQGPLCCYISLCYSQGPPLLGSATPRVRHSQGPPLPGSDTFRVLYFQGAQLYSVSEHFVPISFFHNLKT